MQQNKISNHIQEPGTYRDHPAQPCTNIQEHAISSTRPLTGISLQHRILSDWLVSVADMLSLHRKTLFLAVNYVDRFLYEESVQPETMQLVGTAAMRIAA